MFIWTPLIGFDKEQVDRGVDEYLSQLGFVPEGISLFLFNPDIVHDHDGIAKERTLPPDNCNYYGNARNEIREIQSWSNHDLKELVTGLEARGTATYMGLMGIFMNQEHEWLSKHQELLAVWTNWTGNLFVLKRFKDGTFYEDFFLEKARQALNDYGFAGLHVADGFCPPCGYAYYGDFSDDMLDQFISHTGIQLPAEVREPMHESDKPALTRRATYVWNRHRLEWLDFLSWRWEAFWKKICDGLHADGKKVIMNNAWCSEPFEALYRYGIDYKKLYAAGVDYIAAESLPTSVHMNDLEYGNYRMYSYTTMPSFIKAFCPEGKLLCLNGVKDSTEEWSTITHFPSNVEREIYALTHYFLQTGQGLERAMDGFMVCLGDGLTQQEWRWLKERWDIGFAETPAQALTPTLIWSDHAVYQLLRDYVENRRWSMHKTVYELAQRGGQIGAIARLEQLHHVTGPIFIPNIDLCSEEEIEQISRYDRGPILCTSLVSKAFQLPGLEEPELYFEDPLVDSPMCCYGYRLAYLNDSDIIAMLGEDDGLTAELKGDHRFAVEPPHWLVDLPYRKASSGFLQACAKLIRASYTCDATTGLDNPMLPFKLKNGAVRVVLGNDNRLQYKQPVIQTKKQFTSITSKSKFPSIPAKLLHGQDQACNGFVAKIPPAGMSIFDLKIEEKGKVN